MLCEAFKRRLFRFSDWECSTRERGNDRLDGRDVGREPKATFPSWQASQLHLAS